MTAQVFNCVPVYAWNRWLLRGVNNKLFQYSLIKVLGSYFKKMSYVVTHSFIRRSCEENAGLDYLFEGYTNFSFFFFSKIACEAP